MQENSRVELLLAITISIAVAVYAAPRLWRDFRAGKVLPDTFGFARAQQPKLFWTAAVVQAALALLWGIAITVITIDQFSN